MDNGAEKSYDVRHEEEDMTPFLGHLEIASGSSLEFKGLAG